MCWCFLWWDSRNNFYDRLYRSKSQSNINFLPSKINVIIVLRSLSSFTNRIHLSINHLIKFILWNWNQYILVFSIVVMCTINLRNFNICKTLEFFQGLYNFVTFLFHLSSTINRALPIIQVPFQSYLIRDSASTVYILKCTDTVIIKILS